MSVPGGSETVLQKATRAFLLHNPVKATEQKWTNYALNRVAADKAKIGDKYKEHFSLGADPSDEDEGDDEHDSDEEASDDGYVDEWTQIANASKSALEDLEVELGLPDMTLQRACKLLECDATFEEEGDVSGLIDLWFRL